MVVQLGDRSDGAPATLDLILKAARRCFDDAGFQKTGIDDIAAAAGISRQTVYRYFVNKQDIIEKIGLAEATLMQKVLFERVARAESISAKITETIVTSIIIARENRYVRKIVESAGSQLVEPGAGPGNIYHWLKMQWLPLLEHGIRIGELSDDVNLDDMVRWVLLAEVMLFVRADRADASDDELRIFINRFVVAPLQATNFGAANPGSRIGALESQIRDLQALVAEQALELRALKRSALQDQSG